MSFRPLRFLAVLALLPLAFGLATRGAAGTIPFEIKTLPETTFAGLSREVLPEEIEAFVHEALPLLAAAPAAAPAERAGPLRFTGPAWNGVGKKSVFIVACPVRAGATVSPPLQTWTEPPRRVACVVVTGPAAALPARWDELFAAVKNTPGLRPGARWAEVLLRFEGFADGENRTELQLALE